MLTKSELKSLLARGLEQSVASGRTVYLACRKTGVGFEDTKPTGYVKWFACHPSGDIDAHHPGIRRDDLRRSRLTDPSWADS